MRCLSGGAETEHRQVLRHHGTQLAVYLQFVLVTLIKLMDLGFSINFDLFCKMCDKPNIVYRVLDAEAAFSYSLFTTSGLSCFQVSE